MGKRTVYHVISGGHDCNIEKEGANRASATAPTKAAAIDRAVELAKSSGGFAQVKIHSENARFLANGRMAKIRASIRANLTSSMVQAVLCAVARSRAASVIPVSGQWAFQFFISAAGRCPGPRAGSQGVRLRWCAGPARRSS